ncbi:TorF family putative porin [Novosphingobium sp. RD2P27]|uniref:TorF family putative porin n=1 Tax=Novosphingobium kalidii TaxID=3230299 RepID=A0ABV2D3E6_9SPHN
MLISLLCQSAALLGISYSANANSLSADLIETEVTLVSNYRFRGVSVSHGTPAIQGRVDASLSLTAWS